MTYTKVYGDAMFQSDHIPANTLQSARRGDCLANQETVKQSYTSSKNIYCCAGSIQHCVVRTQRACLQLLTPSSCLSSLSNFAPKHL